MDESPLAFQDLGLEVHMSQHTVDVLGQVVLGVITLANLFLSRKTKKQVDNANSQLDNIAGQNGLTP